MKTNAVQPDLYEFIFKRKSVRKYDLAQLDEKTLSEIEDFINNAKPLYDNIKTEILIVPKDNVTIMLPVRSPHYLVVSSESKEGYLANAGFLLQQIDLFLSSRGIGCCYMGMAQPKKEIRKILNLEFVIIMAIGKPAEPLHRKTISEFQRKSLTDITSIGDCVDLLEPVRLAPSASNVQPWFLTGNQNQINFYCVISSFLKAIVYDKFNKISMGIALYHLQLAAEHTGKNFEMVTDEEAQKNSPKGYYYICTAYLK
ncbi:MAG: nitroreductase family protein [Clostridiaceae bacterium]